MMQEVVVRPSEHPSQLAWTVEWAPNEPQVFHSGASAEACARRLANRLARSGSGVRLSIYLRDGSIAKAIEVMPSLDPQAS